MVFGGRSAEHEVSVVSARAILGALDPERYEVITVGIDRLGGWHRVSGLPAASEGRELPSVHEDLGGGVALSRRPGERALVGDDGARTEIDVVFPMLHGPFGEDGTVQGMLELAGLPYVGAGVLGSAVGMDKAVQKVLFSAAGLPVVRHEVVRQSDWERDPAGVLARAAGLGLPVFVKPAALGSSVGIRRVESGEGISAALEEAFGYGTKALIERAAGGAREIECGVLGNEDPEASVCGEVVPEAAFYDYEAKYLDGGSKLVIPAGIPDAVARRIRRMATRAFRAVDAAGMARVDFFYREPGELLVNEINTIPGFTPVSMYPRLWEASGVSYPDLIDRLIELALERHAREAKRGRPIGEPPGRSGSA